MITHTTAAITTKVIALQSYNPFGGVSPNFGPFKGLLESKVGMVIGLVWALAFCYAAFHLITGAGTLARGRKNGIADAVEDGKSTLMYAAGSIILLAAMPVIYVALAR